MVNPAFPKRQLVGVFSLELARQYGYLYQNTDKDFVILHSLDGYDEVSLTGPFKFFYNGGEKMADPRILACHNLPTRISKEEIPWKNLRSFHECAGRQRNSSAKCRCRRECRNGLYAGHQKQGIVKAMERAKEALSRESAGGV